MNSGPGDPSLKRTFQDSLTWESISGDPHPSPKLRGTAANLFLLLLVTQSKQSMSYSNLGGSLGGIMLRSGHNGAPKSPSNWWNASYRLLTNVPFLLLCLCNLFSTQGLYIPYVYLVELAMSEGESYLSLQIWIWPQLVEILSSLNSICHHNHQHHHQHH